MNSQTPIVLKTILDLATATPAVFNALPELSFAPPLAEKIKAKGCTCGLGGEIREATERFNAVVENLNIEQQARFKHLLNRDPLVFGIIKPESFANKTY